MFGHTNRGGGARAVWKPAFGAGGDHQRISPLP